MTRAASAAFTVERLAVKTPTLPPSTLIDDVAKTFAGDSTLRAMALVEDGRPVGLLNRQAFVDRYARPYFKELYGRKPCMLFANATPLTLDKHTGLDAMTAVLTSSDQRYLTEGFIITEGGRYLGLGTGEQLVRVVTEVRIEAARHANPLTFLPGNIPISEHIDRLLDSGGEFVACYGDLNDFKPYNDHYGYWRGDEMIRLVARTLVSHCDPRRDFVGHVGGDDFVVLFQSDDWLDRCERIVKAFNEKSLSLFDEDALAIGGIEAEDRHGVLRFFKCTTLSMGAVPVRPGAFTRSEQVASAAAAAKHKAKLSSLGLAIEVS
jgi:diguanylate cyclase (GGDEF)-like protein